MAAQNLRGHRLEELGLPGVDVFQELLEQDEPSAVNLREAKGFFFVRVTILVPLEHHLRIFQGFDPRGRNAIC